MIAHCFEFTLHFSGLAVWFWFTLLIGLVWLRRHLQLNAADADPVLSSDDAAEMAEAPPLPTLTVLVAGKEEEANIADCLEGLLKQDYPNLEIIAVNDRSDDRTGAIMDEIAGRDERLRVIHVEKLPAGWAGKNHAMHLGGQQARGDLLCFTDADCRYHARELLRAAVGYAQRERVDFLSVLPELEAHTFWERVVQPPAGAIMVFWFPPQKVNDPQSPRAYANGAFMLMSRSAYEQIGGHEQHRTALNEDMHFARQAKQVGLRLRVLRGAGWYSVRMYVGLRQIWRGWSRIFYGCFGTIPRLLASAIFLSVFSVSPYLTLVLAPLAGSAGLGLALASGATIVAQQSVLWRFYPLCGRAAPWALSYPLGAGVCLGITLNALTRCLGRKTSWRGTSYQGGA